MTIVPGDACSGAEKFGKESGEKIRLDDGTFEPGLQLEQSSDFERAEKIESLLQILLENTRLDSRETGSLTSEDIISRAARAVNDSSSQRDEAEMMIVPERRAPVG